MRDFVESQFDHEGIEALIGAAGNYLEVSDDLRPATIEAARAACRERWARIRLSWIATLSLLLMLAGSSLVVRFPPPSQVQTTHPIFLSNSDELFAIADARAAQRTRSDADWRLVDAFQELRQRQLRWIR